VSPADADGLRATFAEAHRRYTGAINTRFRWTGHLFQGRFGAVAMDEPHLLAASRYIALNPVVAGLVRDASRAALYPHAGRGSERYAAVERPSHRVRSPSLSACLPS
jgi:hypothetical protein